MTAAGVQWGYVHFPEQVSGEKIRKRAESFNDHYSQATLFYNSLSDWEREHLIDACAFELAHCAFTHVRERALGCLNEVDHGLAEAVAARLGMVAPEAAHDNHGRSSPALSLANSPHESIATRKIAILAADGADLPALAETRGTLSGEGALFDLIGVHEGTLTTSDGSDAPVDHGLFAVSSALYDGVLVAGGERSSATLAGQHDARRFVEHCYRHGKAIAAVGSAGAADAHFTSALRAALAAHRDFTRSPL